MGPNCLPRRPSITDDTDPLSLLVYTSGSTGAPKGAMYTESMVADSWRRSARGRWGDNGVHPSISLNFMPMSHMMGRGLLYATLGVGGTAYFAARSDLSTFLEDLALVRPTQLSFVPQGLGHDLRRGPDRTGPQARRPGRGACRGPPATFSVVATFMRLTGSAPMSPEMSAFVEELLDHAPDRRLRLDGGRRASSSTGASSVHRSSTTSSSTCPTSATSGTDRPHPARRTAGEDRQA